MTVAPNVPLWASEAGSGTDAVHLDLEDGGISYEAVTYSWQPGTGTGQAVGHWEIEVEVSSVWYTLGFSILATQYSWTIGTLPSWWPYQPDRGPLSR